MLWACTMGPVANPAKGVTPHSNSYRMMPSAYRSERGVGVWPLMTSGAMYSGVPANAVRLDWAGDSSISRATPKSVILT